MRSCLGKADWKLARYLFEKLRGKNFKRNAKENANKQPEKAMNKKLAGALR
jgi:hypothetical protein